MASRFNQRNDTARSSLFSGYDQARASHSRSPKPGDSNGGNYGPNAFAAYPSTGGIEARPGSGQFRTATPNKRGQYSDAVLNELESQNEDQLGIMSAKVRMLKDITVAIGDEIRDSSALAEKMNESFEGTRIRLRGTMNRMLRMAEKTGIGWRVWLGFFAAVSLLFLYVRW